MVVRATGMEALPNELILLILTPFPTRSLLNLASISRRFHDVILRLVHNRLLTTAAIKDHNLILECFHPSAKWSTPGLPCEYLGTDDLIHEQGEEPICIGGQIGQLGKLVGLYSHFRPHDAEEGRRRRRPHPAGDVPGHPNTSSSQDFYDLPQVATQNVSLDFYELFSQLCTIANLVKLGPKPGLFLSCVTIGEGVIRVFRHWLAKHAISPDAATKSKHVLEECLESIEDRMIWLDSGKNVGVRLRVIARDDLNAPVLHNRDEDPPVSYTLEYEELAIRATQLLLKVEESVLQESNHTGKAMIIGAWRQQ